MDDLYLHPKWIAKRNRILKRDGYKCTSCGSKDDLRVHHTYYINNLALWSYPDESLLTVCNKCHYEYHLTHENIILKRHPHKIKSNRQLKREKIRNKKPINVEALKKKLNKLCKEFSQIRSKKRESEIIYEVRRIEKLLKQANGNLSKKRM